MLGIEQRIDRLEIFAEKLELIISKVGNMDTKLDRFSVSLTEVSTEISDLRSSSSSLKECLTCDRSPNNKQLIRNQLRSELKDTFTEVLLEAWSEDQSGNQEEADQEVVQRFLPKIIQGLQSAEGHADKAWIVDHGEAFADQLATKVASAVAKEVQAQEVDMNELNSLTSEFRSLVGMMKSKVGAGAGANQGQLSTVPEEQQEYRPPSPTTPPEEQDFMTPPAGIADQASKGADMMLESAIRHLNGEAAAAVPAAVQENGSDDDTIDPDIPIAVGEPVEEDSKMTPEELDQYNTAVKNGIEAGVEVLFDAHVEHPEISNLTFSGVETNYRRNLQAEQAAREALEIATVTEREPVAEVTPGAPMIERRMTRMATAAAAAAASRSSTETSEPDPTRLEMDSLPKDDGEQRGRTAVRAVPEANETQARSKSSEKKVQGNLDSFLRTH
jgi:hypothetical protein